MFNTLINTLQNDENNWKRFQHVFIEQEIAAKTVLLNEGEIADKMFFIKKGCLRVWFNKDGKDITTQFFFENQSVSSIESFLNQVPSLLTIESIEPSTIISIDKVDFDELLSSYPAIKDGFQKIILQRLINYGKLFLSRIKDTPQERYEDLVRNNPEIIKRIPQHYIASFLGITPISLSRIRNRKH